MLFEVWQSLEGNEGKTESEWMTALKGEQGLSAFQVWQSIPGNESKTKHSGRY